MSECTDVESRLDAFVDSELSAAEQVDVARHLACCQGCNTIVDGILSVRDGLVAMTSSAVSAMSMASVVPAVMERTARRSALPWRSRRGRARGASALAAGFAVAAGVALMVRSPSPTTGSPRVRVAARGTRPAVIERVVGNVDVRHDRKNGAPIILVNYAGRNFAR